MEEEEEEKEDTQSTEPACLQQELDDLSFITLRGAGTTILVQNVK
jgi:hypothetical protein